MRLTTNIDPEYAWLKKDAYERGAGMSALRFERHNRSKKFKALASPRIVGWSGALIGFILQLAGALWLLSMLGLSIPWLSILAVGTMIAGGIIIIVALTSNARQKRLKSV